MVPTAVPLELTSGAPAKAHLVFADDEWIVDEARIRKRIRHHKNFVRSLNCVRSKGQVSRHGRQRESMLRFEPFALRIEQCDRTHRCIADACGNRNQIMYEASGRVSRMP